MSGRIVAGILGLVWLLGGTVAVRAQEERSESRRIDVIQLPAGGMERLGIAKPQAQTVDEILARIQHLRKAAVSLRDAGFETEAIKLENRANELELAVEGPKTVQPEFRELLEELRETRQSLKELREEVAALRNELRAARAVPAAAPQVDPTIRDYDDDGRKLTSPPQEAAPPFSSPRSPHSPPHENSRGEAVPRMSSIEFPARNSTSGERIELRSGGGEIVPWFRGSQGR